VVRGYADRVEVWKADGMIACHPRSWESGHFELDYPHFIPLLESKPGGLANARAFRGEPWGEDFSRFRVELNYRNPESGERDFVELLLLFTEHPEAELKRAVAECVRLRAWSVAAVRSMLAFAPPTMHPAMDVSKWPGLAVDTDGVRPAAEYDTALLSADGLSSPTIAEKSFVSFTEANPLAEAVGLRRYDERFHVDSTAGEVASMTGYDRRQGWRGGPGA